MEKKEKKISRLNRILNELCRNLITQANIPLLISAITEIEEPFLQAKFLQALLIQEGLTFGDLEFFRPAVQNLLKKAESKSLNEAFYKKYLRMAGPDTLFYLARYEDPVLVLMVFQEIERRVEKEVLTPNSAKKMLVEIFDKQTNEKCREKIWEIFKKLNPSEDELETLLNIVTPLKSLPAIEIEIAQLLEKYRKKWFFRKKKKIPRLVKNIKKTLKQIKGIKRGQS